MLPWAWPWRRAAAPLCSSLSLPLPEGHCEHSHENMCKKSMQFDFSSLPPVCVLGRWEARPSGGLEEEPHEWLLGFGSLALSLLLCTMS